MPKSKLGTRTTREYSACFHYLHVLLRVVPLSTRLLVRRQALLPKIFHSVDPLKNLFSASVSLPALCAQWWAPKRALLPILFPPYNTLSYRTVPCSTSYICLLFYAIIMPRFIYINYALHAVDDAHRPQRPLVALDQGQDAPVHLGQEVVESLHALPALGVHAPEGEGQLGTNTGARDVCGRGRLGTPGDPHGGVSILIRSPRAFSR